MPQRTNPFQQLVHMIESALAPMGAKITESAMEEGREIDVLIETEVGPYKIKIAVEPKDEKRPLDVLTIEQYIGKYQSAGGIKVNQVVIVSSSGFTQTAREKAAQNNIKLLTLEEAEQSDWTKLAPRQAAFRMAPHIESVELVPPVPSKNGKDPLADGRFVCKCHGNDTGSPLQWAEWLFRTQVLPNAELFAQMDAEAKQRNGSVMVSLPWPISNHMLAFAGDRHSIDELKVHIHYASSTGAVKWSSYSRSGQMEASKTIDQMEAFFGGQRMRVVFPNGPKSEKIELRFDAMLVGAPGISPDLPPDKTIAINTRPAAVCTLHTPPARPMAQLRSQFQPKASGVKSARPKKKVGRNAPCPCGSGKKFKQCCLQKN
jgi:hypothetical protein